ncbi:MAG: DNA-directed RNA polymerase subunit L [Candidatus Diapherotrites archaeon]|nr:DNA-directed RNA polymerase subunit L [Candidatus Diapherotrites archaeon]
MKLHVLKNEKNEMEFFIEGERYTLPNILKEKISADDSVEFCAYRLEHPLDKKARFIVKTSGKSPKKVIEDAIKNIKEDLAEFKKEVEKLK